MTTCGQTSILDSGDRAAHKACRQLIESLEPSDVSVHLHITFVWIIEFMTCAYSIHYILSIIDI